MPISVIIPSFKNPKYLDLCIQSAIQTQTEKNEIIVVLDGYVDLSKDVIEKYKDIISVLEFEENQGMSRAINYGVYNSSNEYILVVSEDNVFPQDWDKILDNYATDFYIASPNQIEPQGPSIYNFKFANFGKTVEEFQLDKFLKEEPNFREDSWSDDGSTFPFFMSKEKFMAVGGFDTEYPSPFVVDWDFFLKLELANNVGLSRLHGLNFYHFVSKSTKNRNGYIESANERQKFFAGEQKGAEYFEYKWGFSPKRDKNNRCKQFLKFK